MKGSCWVAQRGDKIKALVAARASLSGAQQGLERSLAALPGYLQFLLEAPVGLASLHKHARTGLETSHSSSGVSLLTYQYGACAKGAALPMPGSLAAWPWKPAVPCISTCKQACCISWPPGRDLEPFAHSQHPLLSLWRAALCLGVAHVKDLQGHRCP